MLRDHFHPPFSDRFGWKSFHGQWAAVITADLNRRLPPGWRAAGEAEFGIEVDVGVVDDRQPGELTAGDAQAQSWQPGEPTLTIPFTLTTDVVEIRVINSSYGPELVGAIELVSPANKDRPEKREAFVTKCASILYQGAGLIIVDVVTSRRANLHRLLLERLDHNVSAIDSELYATAYRPTNGDEAGAGQLRIWEEPLELGKPLPEMPLNLRVGPTMKVDLDATYLETVQQLRIPVEL